jgi:hypothetical protein
MSIQILSTRSKVSSKRFYESFTSNKWCESYVCNTYYPYDLIGASLGESLQCPRTALKESAMYYHKNYIVYKSLQHIEFCIEC